MVRRLLALCLVSLTLIGCGSSSHWTKSHPAYHRAPYGSLSVTGIEEAFVLSRSKWFAKRLKIDIDSIHSVANNLCEKTFLDEMKRGYVNLEWLPDSLIAPFPIESQKLDDRIFMKGRLPEQGVAIKNNNGQIPPQILILHEFIIGTDLKRDDYFDYALTQNETPEFQTSKNLSAIVSYTLWDNEKQRPLFSAVDEIQRPITVLTLNDLDALVRSAVLQIRKNLFEGAQQ